MLFHKLIFNIGQKLRNPSLTQILSELNNSQNLSESELLHIQLDKLRKILNWKTIELKNKIR